MLVPTARGGSRFHTVGATCGRLIDGERAKEAAKGRPYGEDAAVQR